MSKRLAKNKKNDLVVIDIGATWVRFMSSTQRQFYKEKSPETPQYLKKMMRYYVERNHLSMKTQFIIGFPGRVEENVILRAPNKNKLWQGLDLHKTLRPFRTSVINDADLHALLICKGYGLEFVLSLGTGVGSALMFNGRLIPGLEFGHHPFVLNKSYEDLLSGRAYKKYGAQIWQKNVLKALVQIQDTFASDCIYVSGGLSLCLPKTLKLKKVKVVGDPVG